MELRRALLLFAIVLGLAAIATSVSRPPERSDPQRRDTPAPTPKPGPTSGEPSEVIFKPAVKPQTERLEAGRAATVVVEVEEAGQVDLEGLGLDAAAEPVTPARFDVLAAQEGRHRVRFTPAGGGEPRTVGTLVITAAG